MRSQREDLRVSGGTDAVLGDQKARTDSTRPPERPHLDAVAGLQAAVPHEAPVPLTVGDGGVVAVFFLLSKREPLPSPISYKETKL